jgi:hypothetical protein
MGVGIEEQHSLTRGASIPLGEGGREVHIPTPSLLPNFERKGVLPMEKRKEYTEGEIITCPRCGGDNLDCEEAPDKGKCLTCGLEFTVRQVAVWEE